MKTEVKKLDSVKRELTISVDGQVVKDKFSQVYEKLGKEAKVPGFRPGHVPRDILQKNFSAAAHEQVVRELIPELYGKALEQEGLEVVELPDISEVKLEATALSFKATVEVSPEIKLREYRGIPMTYAAVSVSADEVKRSIDSLKEMRKAEAVDEGFARSLGYPSVEVLEQTIQAQLFLQKENAQRQKLEAQIVEALTKGLELQLPESLVKRQTQETLESTKIDFALKGIPKEKIEERESQLRAEIEPQARAQVKVYLLFSAIAKKEGIAQDDQMMRRVMEFLLRHAQWKSE